jgi:hypothetical protein
MRRAHSGDWASRSARTTRSHCLAPRTAR